MAHSLMFFLGRNSKHRRSGRQGKPIALVLLLCCSLLPFLMRLPQTAWEEPADAGDESEALPSGFCARPPLVCAHGGDASNLGTPNTAAAFKEAINIGSDCVEIDVARSSDNVLVVLHVRELQQLMGRDWRPGLQVGDLDWQRLSKLTWPIRGRQADDLSNDYGVLTAEEAVQMTSPYVDCVTLDVKTYDRQGKPTDAQEMAEALVLLVYKTSCTNCLVWAKSDQVVRAIKDISPGQKVGYVVMNSTEAQAQGINLPVRSVQGEVAGVFHQMVDFELRRVLHEQGIKLYVWTVDEDLEMERVLDVGVDALVTNMPRNALSKVQSRLSSCVRQAPSGRVWKDDDMGL